MSVDREQRKKKKRQEKVKAKRQVIERGIRHAKAEEYDWRARNAYHRKEFREALNWALKKLKLYPSDETMRLVAMRCASILNEETTLVTLMAQSYREGRLYSKENHYLLGKLAFKNKSYKLASAVLQELIEDFSLESCRLTGRLSKIKLKDAQEILAYCQRMIEKPGCTAPKIQPPVVQKVPEAGLELPSKLTQADPPFIAQPSPPLEARDASEVKPPELKILFETEMGPMLDALSSHRKHDRADLELTLKAYRLSFRTSYDQLICLPTVNGVRSLWHQEETARKVMKAFRGRAILADEVGLGKTIEAGLIVKEYMMRGLVRTALVLTPSSLVHQWKEELSEKFGIPFISTEDALFKEDPDRFWNEPLILASIQTAKSRRHFVAVTSRSYDIVVVDEAHYVKNRTTLNWKLVNAVQKTFLLMLTATPVQNSLEELYNLVTLLRPGHLMTQKAFKEQFVTKGDPTDPRNREKLRQLLREVMVRNTRSVTGLHIPPRFATTVRVTPNQAEAEFYQGICKFVIGHSDHGESSHVSRFVLKRLLETAGSSHAATLRMLDKMLESVGNSVRGQIRQLVDLGRRIHAGSKIQKIVELLRASPEQKIIFVNHIATLEYIEQVLLEHGISCAVFHGGLSASQKRSGIDAFRAGRAVFLTTGSGGEGHNLQFCHIMVNYDLPWNPMQIEQRIGRIHRIGQENPVQVYNFCAAGSIEDRILEILDRKINMFELVVGEIDMVLGRLQGEEEFSDLVYEIWVKHAGEEDRGNAFDALATRLKRARSAYEKSRELDEKIFHEDFGV